MAGRYGGSSKPKKSKKKIKKSKSKTTHSF